MHKLLEKYPQFTESFQFELEKRNLRYSGVSELVSSEISFFSCKPILLYSISTGFRCPFSSFYLESHNLYLNSSTKATISDIFQQNERFVMNLPIESQALFLQELSKSSSASDDFKRLSEQFLAQLESE